MNRIEQLRMQLQNQFPLRELNVQVGDQPLQITTANDIEELIEQISSDTFNIDERLPYWAELWHSAIGLGMFIKKHSSLFRDKDILDLGCGLGVEGIISAQYCRSVTFADYEENALIAAELNALQNGVNNNAAFQLLDFRAPPSRKWQCIMGADIVYEDRITDPLLSFFEQAVTDDGLIIIAEPNRSVAERFFSSFEQSNFQIVSTPVEAILHRRIVEVGIHCASRSNAVLKHLGM